MLKVFRKLEPGINPELEVLQFLTGQGFANIAPLLGWYDYEGRRSPAPSASRSAFLPDAVGGWELALDQVGLDPAHLLNQLGSLGRVTAELHNVLASDAGDPAFSPEEPSSESLSLLDRDDRRGHRADLRPPARRRRVAPIAGGARTCASSSRADPVGVGGR